MQCENAIKKTFVKVFLMILSKLFNVPRDFARSAAGLKALENYRAMSIAFKKESFGLL